MDSDEVSRQNLLDRTTNILRNILSELESPNSSRTITCTSQSTTRSSPVQTARNWSSSSNPTSSAAQYFRRAFPGLCSSQTQRPQPPPKRKNSMLGYAPMKFQALETWTHDFCILGRANEERTPDRERLDKLMAAGLGKVRVVFPDKNASHEKMTAFLEEKFPKLKAAGGFEILRATGGGGGQRPLALIPPGREGYSVPHIKERLGQAVAFIRPLQVDLDESPVTTQEEDSPKVTCVNCHKSIAMVTIRQHQEVCQGGSSQLQSSEEVQIIDDCKPEKQSVLEEIFPGISKKEAGWALSCAGQDLNKAIEVLLQKESRSCESDDDDDLMVSAWGDSLPKKQEPSSLHNLMKNHRLKLKKHENNRITINRDELWSDSVVLFKSPTFNPKFPLRIRFQGEAGLDAGGLSREYATLLRNAMFSPEAGLFEGQNDRRLPLYNSDAVLANLFVLTGKICSYLISHYDVGIPCLAPACYEYIWSGDIEHASQKCRVEDIPDAELQDLITKVNSTNSESELARLMSQGLSDYLVSAGWMSKLTISNKDVAMWQLITNETLLKRKTPLDHFREGLKTLELLTLVKSNPRQLSCYFTHQESTLKKDLIISLFQGLEQELDDEADERTRKYFVKAIGDLEEGSGTEGLQKLLQFLTGFDKIPPLGMDKIRVEYKKDKTTTLFAETCILCLKLPTVHCDYSAFYTQFELACSQGCYGFGCI